MLDSSVLKDEIQDAIMDTLPNALKVGLLAMVPQENEDAVKICENVGNTVAELFAEPFAERVSSIIDAYIKGADFSGTIITAGSPVTQTAVIVPGGMPVLNGAIPNTLKIQ